MPGVSRVFPGCCPRWFPGVSRVFPGCSQAQFCFSLFYFVKNPHSVCYEAPLIQNISKCTFPWCFPGISWVFPGCFPGVPGHDFFSFTLLKIPTTFAKEVFFSKLAPFILKHASLTQNVSKCTFPGCFPGDSWQMEFPLISSILFGAMFFMI